MGTLGSSSAQNPVEEMNGGWDDVEAGKWINEDADEYTWEKDESLQPKQISQPKKTPQQVLTNEELLLCSTTVRGYSL